MADLPFLLFASLWLGLIAYRYFLNKYVLNK